jgi:NADH dehydrogenase [ubiquinone] 1 alpha subcomplex assembly factor 7
MTALGARIAAAIEAQGPMGIAQFMTMALLDPKEGFYATRDPLHADFITAPEVSQMFGELVGLWLAQAWADQGRPARPVLVELGPGRGTLMRDALRAVKLMPDFRGQTDVVLVEASPVLEAIQLATLAGIDVPIRSVASLDEVPQDRPLFLIANEFFDALPIRQFVKTERGWCERMVSLDANGDLAFVLSPVALPPASAPPRRDDARMGGVYETSPAGEALAEEIAHRVARNGGAALIVDYGYDRPGFGETLQAVAGHKFDDVLAAPGTRDLSAHVDFTALGDAAGRGGARVCGPAEQGAFLSALGIVARTEKLARSQSSGGRWTGHRGEAPEVRRQLERLILPEQMGTLFKALAIVPKSAPTPAGF